MLNEFNTIEIHQYFFANNTRVILPEYARLKRNYEDSKPIFTAAQGVGFIVRSFLHPRQSQASFSFLFYRSAPDEGTCPFPLVQASESYRKITTINASGDMGKQCPLRIISSVPGRNVFVAVNALGSFATPEVLRGGQHSFLSGVHKNLTLVLSGYSMETNFLTGDSQTSYGYNMTVKSVRLPSECLCPHERGLKTMLPEGTVMMNLPKYCTVVYCKWVIPAPTNYMQFAAIFNFTSKFDKLSVSTGDHMHWWVTVRNF
ncbi:hypothetical protein ANCCAN_02317 [Ancylostoma caninum]|uniref:CUB domain-containing protein n=1 Tax=Ancylostoma caninum TaxID=29170 RepID=A0A368H7R0_ANCCA|nr:hypothetical protein ANCCAN_02317 [Ancylostoma caninum]